MSLVLAVDSEPYMLFKMLAEKARVIIFAGLPGVGKSLYLQQQALIAHQSGRKVHVLQWDVTRAAFESSEVLARYPEVDGVTHPGIRKAVGLWARKGLVAWHQDYAEAEHLLIGEVPLMGNRLIELCQPHDDEAEILLANTATQFVIPVPSVSVREHIAQARAKSIASPQHERENADAAPNVLDILWQELYSLAVTLGLTSAAAVTPYHPDIYAGVYQHLLRHRQTITLPVEQVFASSGSVYDVDNIQTELRATEAEVSSIMSVLEQDYTPESLAESVHNWFKL